MFEISENILKKFKENKIGFRFNNEDEFKMCLHYLAKKNILPPYKTTNIDEFFNSVIGYDFIENLYIVYENSAIRCGTIKYLETDKIELLTCKMCFYFEENGIQKNENIKLKQVNV